MEVTQSKCVLIPVAEGSEEIEAVGLADILARGGVKVTLANVGKQPNRIVTMSRGIKLQADVSIEECEHQEYELIVLPGGLTGANNLRDCAVLISMLRKQKKKGKYYGAICASPSIVLATHGLLNEVATAYPGFENQLNGATYSEQNVVVSSNCITSKGPGTTMELGIKLVELLCGKENADSVAKGLLF